MIEFIIGLIVGFFLGIAALFIKARVSFYHPGIKMDMGWHETWSPPWDIGNDEDNNLLD